MLYFKVWKSHFNQNEVFTQEMMAAAIILQNTNIEESQSFKYRTVTISGVSTKSIFEGDFPYCKVKQFFARFENMDSSSNPRVEEM